MISLAQDNVVNSPSNKQINKEQQEILTKCNVCIALILYYNPSI